MIHFQWWKSELIVLSFTLISCIDCICLKYKLHEFLSKNTVYFQCFAYSGLECWLEFVLYFNQNAQTINMSRYLIQSWKWDFEQSIEKYHLVSFLSLCQTSSTFIFVRFFYSFHYHSDGCVSNRKIFTKFEDFYRLAINYRRRYIRKWTKIQCWLQEYEIKMDKNNNNKMEQETQKQRNIQSNESESWNAKEWRNGHSKAIRWIWEYFKFRLTYRFCHSHLDLCVRVCVFACVCVWGE